MNMPLSLQQWTNVPPALRRALIACMSALAAALLLWGFAASGRMESETGLDKARATARKTAALLTAARDARTEHAAHAKRLAMVSAALGGESSGETGRETIAGRLSAHPYISEPALNIQKSSPEFPASEGLPAIHIQRLHVEAGLLHEEALLALNAMVLDHPAHIVPVGCKLRRIDDAAPVTLRANCDFDWISLDASGKSMQ